MTIRAIHTALLVVILSLATACDPGRTNPFDPLARGTVATSISGVVTSYYPPHVGIPNTLVRLEPSGQSVRTDQEGRFSFDLVEFGEYELVAERDGYATRPEVVIVERLPTANLTVRMDALPTLQSASVRSSHVSRWWPEDDLFVLDVVAELDDRDGIGDIDSVWIEMASIGFVDTLVQSDPGRFSTTVRQDRLPVAALDELVGATISLHARDAAGFTAISDGLSLARVIRETPIARTPADLQSVPASDLTLAWQPLNLPYDYTYEVDVVRVETNVEVLVSRRAAIAPTETSIVVPGPLDSGTYYWAVWVVDMFGNRSRSKQSGFTIP